MKGKFQEDSEGREWVERYEEMLSGQKPVFLDLDAWEYVIFHYVQSEEPQKARAACETAMETFPYSAELLLDYAHVLANCGDNVSAMEVLTRAEPFFPHDSDLIVLKCTLLNFEGHYAETLNCIRESLETEPDQKERIFHVMGSTLYQMGKVDESLIWFRKALKLDPCYLECLEELTLCLNEEDRLDEVVQDYRNALDKNPFDADLWLSFTNLLNSVEEFEEALDAVDYCLALDENRHTAIFHRGNTLMNLYRYAEAAIEYENAIKLFDRQAGYYVGLGAALEAQGKHDQAIHWFRKSVKVNPEQDDAYYGIGSCLLRMEKYAESLHFFNKAIQFDEGNPDYWISKAIAEYSLGNVVSAEEAFSRVYEIEPDNVVLWLDWSNLYFEQGHTDKAIGMMDEAIALMPEEALLYYRSAAYHFASGMFKEAVLYLENGILLDYDAHAVLYDFFDDIKTQKTLYRIVQDIRNKGKQE
jgi:tetratricopeptide (TPR) repeat protein